MVQRRFADLPLHGGSAPRWLFTRMVGLSGGIAAVLVDDYGRREFLRRISDPFWFQALACTIGFDWHSSGTTTVTCGALKEALSGEDLGVSVAGGKGRASRTTPKEIVQVAGEYGLSTAKSGDLVEASRMAAKVDSAAVQDRHQIYHHSFFLTEDGDWAVVQQGMNDETGYARRYHWLGLHVRDFVVEPHDAILGTCMDGVLDMTAGESEDARKASVELSREDPGRLSETLKASRDPRQMSLRRWTGEPEDLKFLRMPRRINWDAVRRAYDRQPRDYGELLAVRGVGPATVRALALVSDLLYGTEASWRDPVKYSFTVGGKDGVPYPVDREVMDGCIEALRAGIDSSSVDGKAKRGALRRLREFLPTATA